MIILQIITINVLRNVSKKPGMCNARSVARTPLIIKPYNLPPCDCQDAKAGWGSSGFILESSAWSNTGILLDSQRKTEDVKQTGSETNSCILSVSPGV